MIGLQTGAIATGAVANGIFVNGNDVWTHNAFALALGSSPSYWILAAASMALGWLLARMYGDAIAAPIISRVAPDSPGGSAPAASAGEQAHQRD